MAPRAAKETVPRARILKQARDKSAAQKDKYRCVTMLASGRWVVNARVGFESVRGTHSSAKDAAEAAANAWNLLLNTFVKTSFGVKSRAWTATNFYWIWKRGMKYVLKRKVGGDKFWWEAPIPNDLAAKAMQQWGLTRAQVTKAEVTKAEVISGGADGKKEEEVPATQPYPEDMPEAEEQTNVLCNAEQEHAAADHQDDGDEDSRLPAAVNWGAVKFVVASMASDPCLLPGDISDLERRAAGRTSNLHGNCVWIGLGCQPIHAETLAGSISQCVRLNCLNCNVVTNG